MMTDHPSPSVEGGGHLSGSPCEICGELTGRYNAAIANGKVIEARRIDRSLEGHLRTMHPSPDREHPSGIPHDARDCPECDHRLAAQEHPSGSPQTEAPDDPAHYEPVGMKPQCTYIVYGCSCRLDASHKGLHSPGRLPAAARREEPVNSGQAQPLDVPGLTTLAAEILRFTGGCEEPHRNGEANPHVHLDVTHRWGQRLATLLSSIPEARPAQKHAAWCWLPLDHQGQCEGDT